MRGRLAQCFRLNRATRRHVCACGENARGPQGRTAVRCAKEGRQCFDVRRAASRLPTGTTLKLRLAEGIVDGRGRSRLERTERLRDLVHVRRSAQNFYGLATSGRDQPHSVRRWRRRYIQGHKLSPGRAIRWWSLFQYC